MAGYALPLLADHPVASAASDVWGALQTLSDILQGKLFGEELWGELSQMNAADR